jgi:alkyl hydroperoxide reductase subunit D
MSIDASAAVDAGLSERSSRALERIKEVFKVTSLPEALVSFAASESGINDLYMNLNRQLQDGKVPQRTKLLVATAVAAAAGSPAAMEFFTHAAIAAGRTRQEAVEAGAVAATCTVFNGYYRFRHQVPADLEPVFSAFKAPFNASMFVKPALEQREVEAICIAVSSVNNCHKCVEGHIAKAKSLDLADEQIDEIVKAAAVALAFARVVAAFTPNSAA